MHVYKVSQQAAKCIPSMVCPELTEQIRREIASSLRQRKGDFTCYFLTDLVTFTLPAGTWVLMIIPLFLLVCVCLCNLTSLPVYPFISFALWACARRNI